MAQGSSAAPLASLRIYVYIIGALLLQIDYEYVIFLRRDGWRSAASMRPAVTVGESRRPFCWESRRSILEKSGGGSPSSSSTAGLISTTAISCPIGNRLADSFRLIYYDQRGRGRSADQVLPEEVTLASDIDDLDKVRQHFRLESPALLGHSWGTVLALEYALRHPERVSHMILMNPAPASASDLAMLRKAYLQKFGADMDRQREILASAAYKGG